MSEELILLPAPRQMQRLDGTLAPGAEHFIWLKGADAALLHIARHVQDAVEMVGGRWELAAVNADSARLGAVLDIDPAQVAHPQGYCLSISSEGIRIVAHDSAGLFYAAMTLRQIARQRAGAGSLPCLRIVDWPDFPNRGVMLDISRDKVPTMETLRALTDLLAEWKINQFQLYTEHTFAYRNHREVWEKASPMTGEEMLELDAWCRQRFIELVPNQNSFGHFARWLEHPRYNHLAEAPTGCTTVWGKFHGPFSLCPLDPGSIQLLAELYDELLPNFSSRQFNVGCDETVDLGKGRSKEECDRKGVGRVYLKFLLKIHRLVQKHGRTMQFWGDIIMHHPELIPELPEGVVALEWGYEADHPFDADGQKFAEAGVPFYVCPGTSSWNSIAGRTGNALVNLWNAAHNGLAHGAIGYLNTDWGDHGHWQHLPVSYLGCAYGAAVSWAARQNRAVDLKCALNVHVFHDSAGVMGELAYDLGNAYKETGVLVGNSSVLFRILENPAEPVRKGWMAKLTTEGLERAVAHVDRTMARLVGARMARPDAALVADEFRNAAALLRHGCHLGIARLKAENGDAARIPAETRNALAAELEQIIPEFRRLWLVRNRPGGLPDSAGRMEGLLVLCRGA